MIPPPYVRPEDSPAEATAKAVVAGILFGILFGAANAYLGLRAGLTISASIPVAVTTVALFRALRAAGYAVSRGREPWSVGDEWAGPAAEWLALALFAARVGCFWRLAAPAPAKGK